MADPLQLSNSGTVSGMLTLWRFCDGKPGHERQTAGLVAALQARTPLRVRHIPTSTVRCASWHWLRAHWPEPAPEHPPDLILGAGRACQWPMLAAGRALGGRTVYCMRPGLPHTLFDLCLIPQHDNPRRGPHVEPTIGVLNDITLTGREPKVHDLILVGGPSRHHGWDETALLAQLETVVARATGPLLMGDSRRTPRSTHEALMRLAARPAAAPVSFHAADSSPSDWLRTTLASARSVWVTADSVSMIFEALTAGAGVGLLEVPRRRQDRITRLTDMLLHSGQITSFADWQAGEALQAPNPPLAEAARCADLILGRWS
jgi:mitochondrial fission protein ELM1